MRRSHRRSAPGVHVTRSARALRVALFGVVGCTALLVSCFDSKRIVFVGADAGPDTRSPTAMVGTLAPEPSATRTTDPVTTEGRGATPSAMGTAAASPPERLASDAGAARADGGEDAVAALA